MPNNTTTTANVTTGLNNATDTSATRLTQYEVPQLDALWVALAITALIAIYAGYRKKL